MTIDIAPLTTDAQVNEALRVFLRAMVGLGLSPRDVTASITEPGRYLGAFDGARVVGGADSYGSSLVVPGGARVPHAAVTHIGVLPTHRRRGILTDLVTRQLTDIAARGEVVATLRASEATIYERFGYGVASSTRSARVDLRRTSLRDTLGSGGTVRIVDADATSQLLDAIHRRATWPGAITRPPGWWRLHDLRADAGQVVSYVAVHSTDGVDDGYVVYQPRDTDAWFTSREKTIAVTDFVALTDTARTGLWRHLFALDLVDVVAFDAVPLDDPLPLAVVDTRAVELGAVHDETWLRLIDVEQALSARTFAEHDPVTVAVRDAQIASNTATFEISAKSISRTSDAAEVSVDVATLGAAYLGGTRWRHLAAAGRVTEHRPGAVTRLDGLFGTDLAPFAGTVF